MLCHSAFAGWFEFRIPLDWLSPSKALPLCPEYPRLGHAGKTSSVVENANSLPNRSAPRKGVKEKIEKNFFTSLSAPVRQQIASSRFPLTKTRLGVKPRAQSAPWSHAGPRPTKSVSMCSAFTRFRTSCSRGWSRLRRRRSRSGGSSPGGAAARRGSASPAPRSPRRAWRGRRAGASSLRPW